MDLCDWKRFKRSGGYRRKVKNKLEHLISPGCSGSTSVASENNAEESEGSAGSAVKNMYVDHQYEEEEEDEYDSKSAESDEENDCDKNHTLTQEMQRWAIKFNISLWKNLLLLTYYLN